MAVVFLAGQVTFGFYTSSRTEWAGSWAARTPPSIGSTASSPSAVGSSPARWNTSLKVAVYGWTLAGVRARTASRASAVTDGGNEGRHKAVSAVLAGVLVIATVLSSAPFPVFAGYTEMGHVLANDTEFRLDGLGTHDRDRSKEVAAIEWLGDRGGRPVVLEAPGRRYQWSSSVSTMTGLPTLVGWVHH